MRRPFIRREGRWALVARLLPPALLIAVTAGAQEPVEVLPPQNKVLSNPNGRYIFGQISKARRDQYLLDTQTGRVWQVAEGEDGRTYLQPVRFISVWGYDAFLPEAEQEVLNIQKLIQAEFLKQPPSSP